MADAKLDAHRIGLIVDDREKSLSLPRWWLEVAQLAVVCIVLKRGCPSLREIVGHRAAGAKSSEPKPWNEVSMIGLAIISTGPKRTPIIGRISPELRVGSQ